MRRLSCLAVLAAACAAAPAAWSQQAASPSAPATTEVAGVRFPATMQVAGTRLALNGAGVRYKLVFKVYAAGLYLAEKASTPEAVIAASGPRHLQIVMLREIDANELGRLFTKGMEQNAARDEFARSIPGIMRMSDIFSRYKKLKPGESFAVEWVPGRGTMIFVNGESVTEPIKEPEFYSVLMKIWLGASPADAQLKEALLGRGGGGGSAGGYSN